MWLRFKLSGGQNTPSQVMEQGPQQESCQRCQGREGGVDWFKGMRLCEVCREDLS